MKEATDAFKSGKTLSDNPYPTGTREHQRWQTVWYRASCYYDWRDVPHPMDRFLRSAQQITHDAAGVAAVLEDVA